MTTTAQHAELTVRDETNGQAPQSSAMVEAAVARQAQEVQAAMVIAKRFPRNEVAAFNRIVQACKRRTLAEHALYAYPRGGTTVTGPSIRMAEALAQSWGNVDFGIVELEQRLAESTVMSYAWDLETNSRQVRIFTVPHKRFTKQGSYMLTDPRDIYEMVANQGARRLRACILGIIPGDVVDAAVEQCEKTLAGGTQEPLIDRVRKMVVAFAAHGVTQEMIEGRLAHKIDATVEAELVQLRKCYKSIEDGMAKREDFFGVEKPAKDQPAVSTATGKQSLADKLAARQKATRNPEPAAPEPVPDGEPEKSPTVDESTEQPAEPIDQDQAGLKDFTDDFHERLAAAKSRNDLGAIARNLAGNADWLGEEIHAALLAEYRKRSDELEAAEKAAAKTTTADKAGMPSGPRARPRAADIMKD